MQVGGLLSVLVISPSLNKDELSSGQCSCGSEKENTQLPNRKQILTVQSIVGNFTD
jgi:hypothetical protein